ncbi:glutathione S-transferase N-terminal domain-containing protein [Rhodovulum sp.]|uniref:glutathione S-transferase N-terminal domain-containing protein n=1 Tax=Rhodovulum sp. TaxID=34009 RepID=UPI001813CA3E|nr:glutathione S-transferase N-terminal domain-containing protein [Rhodovulum sp.]HDR27686.1 glutathione S-transferase [Rhodovulum sp.]
MTTLADFPVTKRWPPRDPRAIQLYSYPTPNGVKASIMLEETGLPYDAHRVDFNAGEQMTGAFLSLNPNNKIPAIIDPEGPDGAPMALFESGAILIYLAEKTGQFLPTAPRARHEVLQWLMFQMGGVGPMFGQMGFFVRFKGTEIEDPRPRERYVAESRRLLTVLDRRMEARAWICGDYSIADIALLPWLRSLLVGYEAGDLVGWTDFANLHAWLDRFLARPAVQRGLVQPPRA